MSAEPVSSSGAPGPLPVTRAGVLGPPRIEIKRVGRTVWQREGFIKAKAGCIKGVHCGGEWIWYPVVHGHSGFEGLLGFAGWSLLLPLPAAKVCRSVSYTAPAQSTTRTHQQLGASCVSLAS